METTTDPVATLQAAVAGATPERLDAFLATLPPGAALPMNDGCGCYLHRWWAGTGAPDLAIRIDFVAARTRWGDICRVAVLPSWLAEWQRRCIEVGVGWGAVMPASSARAILAKIVAEREEVR